MPEAIWTIKDILIVLLFWFVGLTLFILLILGFLGDIKRTLIISLYASALLGIFIPLYWIKLRYGLSKEALGFRKGNLRTPLIILIGLATGIICFLMLTPLRDYSTNLFNEKTYSIIDVVFFPLSIGGSAIVILAPISEEILVRGFIYGYLRKKLGIISAIFLQSLFFTFLHPDIYFQGLLIKALLGIFISGIILGFLYEKTASLYPGIICHGMINYLAIIAWASHNMTLAK